MFFGAFLGHKARATEWRRTMNDHAHWLGLTARIDARPVRDGRTFTFGWLKAPSVTRTAPFAQTDEWVVMTTGCGSASDADLGLTLQAGERLTTTPRTNAIHIRASLTTGDVQVVVPLATPEQFYFSDDAGEYAFASDLRLLLRFTGLALDERAVFALFQYGRIPPPFSISRAAQRVPWGHVLTVSGAKRQTSVDACVRINNQPASNAPTEKPETLVRDALDRVLASVPDPAALYFSGGVDSTLIAARLAAMGRTDVKLVNYSWGPGDERAELALAIASHLRMDCEQVVYDPADLSAVLGRLGADYSFPFGGRSAIPTNLMVHAAERSFGPLAAVIEGTGADGMFGLGSMRLWRLVYRIPAALRRCAGAGYKWTRLWRRDSGESRLERRGAVIRRSTQLPFAYAAVLAQNSLDGIAYRTPRGIRRDLIESLDSYTSVLGNGLSTEDRFALLDLVAVCAGEFAAKCFDPVRRLGGAATFPFLEPAMLSVGMSLPWATKCVGGKEKALLKTMLARSIPREWVYLPKDPFTPPFNEMLAHETMQDFLRGVVLSSRNPLLAFCRVDVIRHLADRTARGQGTSWGAQKFLWTLMFASGWLNQLECQSAQWSR